MHQDTPLTGHLLFAHGSRDPLWRLPVEAVAARMCELAPSVKVSCAYLELCEPTLAQAAADMVAQGVRHIHVVPMFLGVGRHAREDLPVLMADLQKTYPEPSNAHWTRACDDRADGAIGFASTQALDI